jgi:hypothetical protein
MVAVQNLKGEIIQLILSVHGRTDVQGDSYIPPKLCLQGYNKNIEFHKILYAFTTSCNKKMEKYNILVLIYLLFYEKIEIKF